MTEHLHSLAAGLPKFRSRHMFGLLAALVWNASAIGMEPPTAKVDFSKEIKPILAEHCWSCHGLDKSARKAKLRLDVREEAVARHAIVPGDADASAIFERIESEDPEVLMPPPRAKKPLNDRQKQLLRDWVAQGAEYRGHWAFVPPTRPELPKLKNDIGVRNPIDRFVRAELERAGLEPSPEADKATLLRRVTLDVTGLPPTIDEQTVFLADKRADAYERVVERLLASPRYAERMAMSWLDAARYADTNGYNNDEDRLMWPWRDWVIRSFDRNQPYDQFIVEQLAGDLIPNATLDQKIASGFHRNQGHNTEGGIIAEEYRVEYVADRVHATATVFLGLSLQCARCHDHKYDPLTQKEYYQFYGFFNSLDEKQGGYKGAAAIEPFVKVPSPEQAATLAELSAKLTEFEKRVAEKERAARAGFTKWETEASEADRKKFTNLDPLIRVRLDESSGESAKIDNSTEPGKVIGGDPKWRGGKIDGALELADKAYIDLGPRGSTNGSEPFSISVWIRPDSNDGAAILSKMDEDHGYRGYDILNEAGKVVTHLIHEWPANALKVTTKETISSKKWHHLAITYDGTRKSSGLHIYIDGKLAPFDVQSETLTKTIATDQPLRLGLRQRSLPFQGALDDFQWFGSVIDVESVERLMSGTGLGIPNLALSTPAAARTQDQWTQLERYYLDRIDTEYQILKKSIDEVKKRIEDYDKSLPVVMIMRDLEKRRETFLLNRGKYDSPGEKVEAGVPAVLGGIDPNTTRNRLALARWIVASANPLTARVAVNRWWEMYFGAGLVRTVEDFGAMGESPSHPELLDYLATELIGSGWNVKAMQKLLVTSATYRQSSHLTPKQLESDPENRLLARGARYRLPAETVRDNALAISGLLKNSLGGPSVKPYQPEGLWEDVSVERRAKYIPEKGDDLYRRSMYTFWKRTCPPPTMTSFDAGNRELCVVRRGRTNTPLQALILLNDPTYIEASRKLAERVLLTEQDDKKRLDLAFRAAASRTPTPQETTILLELHNNALGRFAANPKAAETLLTVGDSAWDKSLKISELAAWSVTCSTILNMDEVISKR